MIDTATLAVGTQIQLGTEQIGMALDTKRGKTYITNYGRHPVLLQHAEVVAAT